MCNECTPRLPGSLTAVVIPLIFRRTCSPLVRDAAPADLRKTGADENFFFPHQKVDFTKSKISYIWTSYYKM